MDVCLINQTIKAQLVMRVSNLSGVCCLGNFYLSVLGCQDNVANCITLVIPIICELLCVGFGYILEKEFLISFFF